MPPAYARPSTLTEALAHLVRAPHLVLAGGTDLYPGAGAGLAQDVLDLTAIPDLCRITVGPQGARIGACVTWGQISDADLPPALHGLQQAARQVGGWQIQQAGTIGGNLCNASPAADGVPPLLVAGAEVELAGPQGLRRLDLSRFLIAPRRTGLGPGEVLVAVILPADGLQGQSRFLKLGARSHLVISIAMVAVRIVTDGRLVTQAAVAVGACSGVALRLPAVEQALIGMPRDRAARAVRTEDLAALTPLDDLRASADYRRIAAAELVARAVTEAATCG